MSLHTPWKVQNNFFLQTVKKFIDKIARQNPFWNDF